MTEAQKRAYVLADNKLALNAGWDEQLLALELGELAALELDFDSPSPASRWPRSTSLLAPAPEAMTTRTPSRRSRPACRSAGRAISGSATTTRALRRCH
jgi:hypothetical protein